MLNVALVTGVVFMLLFLFGGEEPSGKYILLPIMYVSGGSILLLPLALIFAAIKRTRAAGGALFYIIASLSIMWLWLFALISLYQNAGKWPAVIGFIVSLFSSGLGMFAVFGLMAIVSGQWTAALLLVGAAALCRVVSNLGKSLMGLRPSEEQKGWV